MVLNRVIMVAKLFYHHIQSTVNNEYLKIVVLNRQSVEERHQVATTCIVVLKVAHLPKVTEVSLVKSSKKSLG